MGTSQKATKRYAGLIRISHMGERKTGDDNVHADRDQTEAIERCAKSRDFTVTFLPPELDVSGGLPLERRPSLMRAIEGVEAGEFDGVAVAYLSRFGRNLREQLRAWDRIEAAGGDVLVVQENIDTSTPSGRLQRNFLLSIAEHEREQHTERFEHLREWATSAGVWQRRQTPTGYRRDDATRRLVPDDRADDVRSTFRDFVAGATITALADRLRMTHSGVRALLRNSVYLGELRVGKHVNATAHEPIVDAALFRQAQDLLASRPRPARGTRPVALLAGLIRCSGCGHVMTRGGSGTRLTYRCPGRHSGERCPSQAAVAEQVIEDYVEQIALAELDRLTVRRSEDGRLAKAQRDVLAAEEELAAFLQGVEAAGLAPADFADAARLRKGKLDEARATLASAEATSTVITAARTGREAWADLTPQERNALLRSLLTTVVVEPAGRGRRVPIEERAAVVRFGADLELSKRRGHDAIGIRPLAIIDLPVDDVLSIPAAG